MRLACPSGQLTPPWLATPVSSWGACPTGLGPPTSPSHLAEAGASSRGAASWGGSAAGHCPEPWPLSREGTSGGGNGHRDWDAGAPLSLLQWPAPPISRLGEEQMLQQEGGPDHLAFPQFRPHVSHLTAFKLLLSQECPSSSTWAVSAPSSDLGPPTAPSPFLPHVK